MGADSDEENSRNLRVKQRRHYTEDCLQDEEIEGRRMFSVEEKLLTDQFESGFVDEMKGDDFNLKFLQEHGFVKPLLFKEKSGLGMRMPSANFTVNDVRQCVGSRRLLDVMDVTTQKDIEMTMKEWCKYYENTNRDQLLNVISLEFSHTKLENYVESPTVVRQMDWVDWVWPRHLKESQTEGTNSLDEMKYPKVQKYCLMSVKGCYTDFHIDFGGTSVWYHILRGKKIFWLIPPTEKNIALFETWVLSGKQGDVFFGDTVEKCSRVQLDAGNTFFIPTGWIHAVYTPEDSLVFGGNFLHNFGIEKQLRIAEVEDLTHVPGKFRYPFYTEILWYVIQRFVHCLMGKNYLICNENGDLVEPQTEKSKFLNQSNGEDFAYNLKSGDDLSDKDGADSTVSTVKSAEGGFKSSKDHVHLSKLEYFGLKAILRWLIGLPPQKKGIPFYIRDPDGLLEDLQILINNHENDDPQLAITGKPSLFWFDTKKQKVKQRSSSNPSSAAPKGPKSSSKDKNANARRRRTRCKKCEACMRADCGDCHFCKDMKKFGGPGRMKQSCISRQCMAPVLPHTACCMICGRDGWDKLTNPPETENSSLMECSQCWEILHPKCLHEKNPDLPMESCVNEDLPNSWECPKCVRNGKPDQIKPRQMKSKSSKGPDISRLSISSSENGMYDYGNESVDVAHLKVENGQNAEEGISKRIYDNEPLDLVPHKKKIKMEMPKIKQEYMADYNYSDSIATNRKFNLPEKQDNMSGQYHAKEVSHKFKKVGHMRPYSRLPLHMKKIYRSEQGKVLRVKNVNDIRSKSRLAFSVPMRRHPETARERLFRNMKGLKKNLLIKSKSLGKFDESTNKPVLKEVKLIQSYENIPIKQEVLNLNDDIKADVGSYPHVKIEKGAEKTADPFSPMIISMLRDSPYLKKPKYVIRPAPIVEDNRQKNYQSFNSIGNLAIEKEVMLPVFSYLSLKDLNSCQLVCKRWNRWSVDPRLWTSIDLTRRKLTASTLMGIVRRQPLSLNLSWTNLSRKQLSYLIARLPQMSELVLSGCSATTVLALCTCNCPLLRVLDLSWVEGLGDGVVRDLLAAPPDSRPGFSESKTRLRHLAEVKLAGADISDVSVRLMTHHLPALSRLDFSHCHKVTDMGIAVLGAAKAGRLHTLDVSACSNITDTSLDALKRCSNLSYLDLRDCGQVTDAACAKFVAQSRQTMTQKGLKLIVRNL